MASLLDSTSIFTEKEPSKTWTDVYYTWDEEEVGEGDWDTVRTTHTRQVPNPAWAAWNKRKQAFEAEKARKAEEARRVAEEKKAEELRKAGELRKAEEARRVEELRRAEEARRVEEARRAEEVRRAEE